MDKRRFHSQRLTTSLALLAVGTLFGPPPAPAFDLQDVTAKARSLAAHQYRKPHNVPAVLQALNYDQYHSIHFLRRQALWPGSNFRVQFFSPGFLFKRSVIVHMVEEGHVRRIPYKTNMFDYGGAHLGGTLPPGVGFAGFRVHFTPDAPPGRKNHAQVDEFLVFQGASYFRTKGVREPYGVSARGIAIDTAGPPDPRAEEFPRFSEFWLVRPPAQARSLTIYALLNGPSITGAYRFRVYPGKAESRTDVKAVLFLRKHVAKLGLAPLTSMYMYRAGEHRPPAYLRPAVHDSGGLLLQARAGQWIWRPLRRPRSVREYTFALTDPKGFGLLQRDRDFDDYQSLTMNYEQRPSAWVIPSGRWGPGKVHLVELPTGVEWQDNIVAFWVPAQTPAPGKPRRLSYRIEWGLTEPDTTLARVTATRIAAGGRPGTKVVSVDFAGTSLKGLGKGVGLQAYITVSGGTLLQHRLHNVAAQHLWRLRLTVAQNHESPIQLRAVLHRGDKNLSETWDYVIPSPAAAHP